MTRRRWNSNNAGKKYSVKLLKVINMSFGNWGLDNSVSIVTRPQVGWLSSQGSVSSNGRDLSLFIWSKIKNSQNHISISLYMYICSNIFYLYWKHYLNTPSYFSQLSYIRVWFHSSWYFSSKFKILDVQSYYFVGYAFGKYSAIIREFPAHHAFDSSSWVAE